jgi:response regulator RpfG family c-di-GMP phosphodiesterase
MRNGSPAGTRVSRALAIGKSTARLKALAEVLEEEGSCHVRIELEARVALPAFREYMPDVVLIEQETVRLDTLATVVEISSEVGPDEFLPFVIFAFSGRPTVTHAAGVAPFPAFYQDGSDLHELGRVVLRLLRARRYGVQALEQAAVEAARVREMEIALAHRLAVLSECRDHPQTGHVFRVGKLSAEIGRVVGLTAHEVELIGHAAPLHDVGQLAISDAILLKDGLLSLEEMDIVKMHTSLGATLLAGTGSEILRMAESIALFHHENWDGTGYVPGVEGTSIPLPGRIVRVADAFDAMTNPRPFAARLHVDGAIDFIRKNAGRFFDPAVVEAFLEVQDRAMLGEGILADDLV